jgi:hypothetical protein
MEKEKDKKSQMDLCELADMVDHSVRKIAFLREFFSHNVPDDELFSKDGRAGFHFIMDNIEDDLEFVVDRLYKVWPRGSVPEEGDVTPS